MIDFFSKTVIPAYDNMFPNTKYSYTYGEEYRKNLFIDKEYLNNIDYQLNNYGHRCDNFKLNHEYNHILFAGCSFTFGESLPYMQNWSGKLYKKFLSENKLDGYFALGFLNGFTSHIVYNIMLYCESFGFPETIFCFFPQSERTVKYINNELLISYKIDKEHKETGRVDSFKSISFLEKYCEINKIKLFWSTWDNLDADFYKKQNFNNFIFMQDSDIHLAATNKDEKENPFFKIGRDQAHPGLSYSDGVANIFFEKIKGLYEK